MGDKKVDKTAIDKKADALLLKELQREPKHMEARPPRRDKGRTAGMDMATPSQGTQLQIHGVTKRLITAETRFCACCFGIVFLRLGFPKMIDFGHGRHASSVANSNPKLCFQVFMEIERHNSRLLLSQYKIA